MQVEISSVWKTEQEILDVVDHVCREHGIKYSLFYGTLLGAVRHKGFIPWDDDIDIVMPREEYKRFLKAWEINNPQGYVLQEYHETPDYPNNFTKIRKDKTAFVQSEKERSKRYHKGIFIDIFPLDRQAPTKLARALQYAAGAVNLLYSREYTSGSKGIIGLTERLLLKFPKAFHRFCLKQSEKILQRWNDRENMEYFSAARIQTCKVFLPVDLFDDLQEIEFCGRRYPAVKNTDEVLRIVYGNYMQLPPESKRVWFHHPLLVDFNRNYEEIPENERYQ